MKPDAITTKSRPSKKSLQKWLIVGVIAIAACCIGAWYIYTHFTKTKPTNSVSTSAPATDQDKSREAILAATDAPDAGAEQKYVLLMTKIGTAQSVNDWKSIEQYSKDALALKGYSMDIAALLDLSSAQKQLNETSDRKGTLMKLKQYYEENKMTQTDQYKAVVEELK